MAGDDSRADRRRRVNRERVVRTLTFWLRPEFVLRVVNRFQKVAGFDRAIALASAALTATIPLTDRRERRGLELGGKGTADRIIDRYELTGGGAEAVRDIFSPPAGHEHEPRHPRVPFLLVAVLSFSRAVQRLFEQTWELDPLSVRNTFNGLLWIGGLAAVPRAQRRPPCRAGAQPPRALGGAARHAAVGGVPGLERLGAQRQADRAPGPPARSASSDRSRSRSTRSARRCTSRTSSTRYATRYGVIGAVFAMISALFCVMVVLVASAAAGREIRDELDRIQRGERPAEDEVRRQWDRSSREARSRWDTLREQIQKRRHQHRGD